VNVVAMVVNAMGSPRSSAPAKRINCISPYGSPRGPSGSAAAAAATSPFATAAGAGPAQHEAAGAAPPAAQPPWALPGHEGSAGSLPAAGLARRGHQEAAALAAAGGAGAGGAGGGAAHFLDDPLVQQYRLVALHGAMGELVSECRATGGGLHFVLPMLLLCLRQVVRETFGGCFPLWCLRPPGQQALALMDLAVSEVFDRHGFFGSASCLAAMPAAVGVMQQQPGRRWHAQRRGAAAAQPGAAMAAVLGLAGGGGLAASGSSSDGTRRLLAAGRRTLRGGAGAGEGGAALLEGLPLGTAAQTAALRLRGCPSTGAPGDGSVLKTALAGGQRQEVLRGILSKGPPPQQRRQQAAL
jgi:hypothetical protein